MNEDKNVYNNETQKEIDLAFGVRNQRTISFQGGPRVAREDLFRT